MVDSFGLIFSIVWLVFKLDGVPIILLYWDMQGLLMRLIEDLFKSYVFILFIDELLLSLNIDYLLSSKFSLLVIPDKVSYWSVPKAMK